MFKHYVIAIRSDLVPGDVQIVGPFENGNAAVDWGHDWQAAHNDNPCWQTVTLPDGFAPSITAATGL